MIPHLFFGAISSVLPVLFLLAAPRTGPALALFGALSVAAYAVALFLDVRRTVAFGVETVSRLEISLLFSYFAKRFGFGVAVPVQVAAEAALAVLAVPLFVSYRLDAFVAVSALCVFAVFHCAGWLLNRSHGGRANNRRAGFCPIIDRSS